MKLHMLFEQTLFNKVEHADIIKDVDIFLSNTKQDLKPSTIDFLKSKNPNNGFITVYRVIYSNNLEELAKQLSVDKIQVNAHVIHSAQRVSSWSASKSAVIELAEENDDLGDFAVVLKTTVEQSFVVLNTTMLSIGDLELLRNGHAGLIQVIKDQKEVILDKASYECQIIEIIAH